MNLTPLSPLSVKAEDSFTESNELSFAYNENMTWAGRFGARSYNYWSPVEVWDVSDSSNMFQLLWMMKDSRPLNGIFESGDEINIIEYPYSIGDSAGTGEVGMWPDASISNTPGNFPSDWSMILSVEGITDTLGNENWAIPNVDS